MAKVGPATIEVDIVVRSITFPTSDPDLITWRIDPSRADEPYIIQINNETICRVSTLDVAENIIGNLERVLNNRVAG